MNQSPYDEVPIAPQARSNSPWMIIIILLGGCGVLGVAVIAVMAAVLFPVFAQSREAARKAACLSNVKQASMGLQMYCQDYDEKFPPPGQWQAALNPYIKNTRVYVCPSRQELLSGYAYNSLLDKKSVGDIAAPANAPTIFESNVGLPNYADQLQSFTVPHIGVGAVGFADGHVKSLASAPSAATGISQKALRRDGQLARK